MIDKLTVEQEEQIDIWRKRWFDIGSSTDPANKPRAENAIVSAYEKAGFKKPKNIVWVDSPADAATTIECLNRISEMNKKDNDRQRLRWNEYKKEIIPTMDSMYVGTFFLGAQDAYWVAYYKFCAEVLGIKYKEEDSITLDIWSELCHSCGWWWPYEETCIVSDRPSIVKWDTRQEPNVLHCETGPALQYRDGWSVYCWRGTRIPREWIEDKNSVDVSLTLTWKNIEQRRCLSEIIGWDKVIEQLNVKVIDKDKDPMIGELLEVDLPNERGAKFLRVLCGTGVRFVVPVGIEHMTAIEANAASYNITPEELRGYEYRT